MLCTRLCNQDSVEHTNSKIRARGGFNPNPTPRTVRLTFRHMLSIDFMYTSDYGNVQCNDTGSLFSPSDLQKKLNENLIICEDIDDDNVGEINVINEDVENACLTIKDYECNKITKSSCPIFDHNSEDLYGRP